MPYLSLSADGTVLLRLHVQPKASKNRIVGLHDGCLKLAVAAPPVEGRANREVVRYLAELLGLPPREVRLCSGELSRKKVVAVGAMDEAAVRSALERLLAAKG